MEFRSILTGDTKEFVSEPGNPFIPEYEYSLDKDGKKQLVKKDTVDNIYERIQAERDSCDINKLMERFALGDTEALNINKGFYLDTREMPKSYFEVLKLGLEAQNYFEGLPVDLKKEFDNSYSVFFTEMGSKEFEDKISSYNDRFVNHQYDEKSNIKEEIEHNE